MGRLRVVVWILPILLILLTFGVTALGMTRGWHPELLLPHKPDLTATAVTIRPLVEKALRTSDDRQVRSLACACDTGLKTVTTGNALLGALKQVKTLKATAQHRDVAIHHWRVDWTHVLTDSRAQAQVTASDTEYLYQGLERTARIDGSYLERYRIVRVGGVWKVSGSQIVGESRHASPIRTAPPMTAQAVFLMDDTTGRTLYAYRSEVPRFMASTAKTVTALVARKLLKLNAVVTVPSEAAVEGTTAGLVPGERMRVRDLFYGMLLPSGNDAAITLADAAAGNLPAFVRLMNKEAGHLHLKHSHFLTPHGLDTDGQYSTAHDLALVAHALLRHRFLARVVHTAHYHALSVDRVYVHDWTTLNHLLGSYPGAIGVKTGTTPGAGANLIAAAVRGKHRLIAVVLGDTYDNRFPDAAKLLNYGWRLLGYPVH
ncbi:MAG: hypothetical protein NVSMB52_15500 [Chloroflexota bacterium]